MKTSFSDIIGFKSALLIFLSTLILQTNSAKAQKLTKFSEDPALFPYELQGVVKDHIKTEDGQIMRNFPIFWNSDTLSTEQKVQIVEVSNQLLKKTAISTQHFITLAKILVLDQNN